MPGNVKLGSSNEPDPDPTPYLCVSAETKRSDLTKPYDPKKSVWVPDGGEHGGFIEAMLDSEGGGKTTVMVGHEVSNTLQGAIEYSVGQYLTFQYVQNIQKELELKFMVHKTVYL